MWLFGPPNVERMKARKNVRGLIKALGYEPDWRVRARAAGALARVGDERAVEALIVALKAEHGWVCKAAASALGAIGDPRAVEPLIACLSDAHGWVRKASDTPDPIREGSGKPGPVEKSYFPVPLTDARRCAVAALGAIGDRRAVEPLIAALEDESREVRKAAASALGQIGDPRGVEPLITTLKDPHVFLAAGQALVDIGGPAVQPLVEALADSHRLVRRAAAEVLDRIGWQPDDGPAGAAYWIAREEWDRCGEIGQSAVEPLIAALEDARRDVRLGAARALGVIGDPRAVGPLMASLNDDRRDVRLGAARALGAIGDPRALEPLIGAAKDKSPIVRKAAASGLGQIGDQGGVEPLVAALDDDDLSVREAAADALDRIGWQPDEGRDGAAYWIARAEWSRCAQIGQPGVEPLIAALKDGESSAREAAADALVEIGGPALEPLIAALNDSHRDVRSGAARALVEIGDPRAVGPLIALLKDKSWKVRKAAASALSQIGDPQGVEPLIAALKDDDSRVRGAAAEALAQFGSPAKEQRSASLEIEYPQPRERPADAGMPACEVAAAGMAETDDQVPGAAHPSLQDATQRQAKRAEERVIRVFISSTFRDMHTEREELIKRVSPQLRKLCEERGVTWGEVDLRWGITEEQAQRGEVLPICLEEIRRCRPYFIGLLGERYGWVPGEHPEELVEEQPWLEEHLAHSITELEILHGVLKDPEMAHHAYFYFRDPAYVASLPAEVRDDYKEGPTEDEVEEYGAEEAERLAEERRQKLRALKARIKSSGLPVREDYEDPVALGELVLEDLTGLIDRLYPEGEQADPLDREAAEHEAFAASRGDVYIGRRAYTDRLDAHARGDGEPLVVLGESGSGKSALLSNWALRYREEHPDDLVLMHFIGASPYSTDWRAMLRRLIGELQRHFDLEGEIPDDAEALRRAFANWLYMAAAASKGRVVLILDGLNQLEEREGAPDLVWLPPQMPENVRLVASTLPGRPLDALTKRGWPSLDVEPLEPGEREKLIVKYLAQYSKALTADRVVRIAAAPQSSNPLYLRALLEELRVFGVHALLDERIDHYLGAATVPALYTRILERYESDYERERPELVGDAMSLLWGARRGLSEAEMLQLLGADGEPLPQAHWAPLYLAAEPSLLSRAGLIGFGHVYLRRAVRDRYLATEGKRKAVHQRLADYFAARDLGPRQIDELPWQLEQAGEWRQLYDLLADLDFLQAAREADEFEVNARWAQVEANSRLRLVDAYRPVVDEPGRHTSFLWVVACLLYGTGHIREARLLEEYKVEHYRQVGDHRNLSSSLHNLGNAYAGLGQAERAIEHYEQALAISREIGNRGGEGNSLNALGCAYDSLGQTFRAIKHYHQALVISREIGDRGGEGGSLNNLGLAYARLGQVERAIEHYEQALASSREIGNRRGESTYLGNLGVAYEALGQVEQAVEHYEQALAISRKIGDRHAEGGDLGNLGLAYARLGQVERAIEHYEQALASSREIGDRRGEGNHLNNLGNAYVELGQVERAIQHHQRALAVRREIQDRHGEGDSLGNLGNAYAGLGQAERAIEHYEQALAISREIGDRRDEGTGLNNLGRAYEALGQVERAIEHHQQALAISREIGDRRDEGTGLNNLGRAYEALGQVERAIEHHQQALAISREIGDRRGEGSALGNLGSAYKALGQVERAIEHYEQALAISRELGDRRGEGDSLYNLGNAYVELGQVEWTIEHYEQALAIHREIGDRRAEGSDLGNLGNAYADLGQVERAIEHQQQALVISREIGDRRGEGNSLGNLGTAYHGLGQVERAIEHYEQALAIHREMGDRRREAIRSWNLGLLFLKSDPARAVELMSVQVAYEREIGHPDAESDAALVAWIEAAI